MSLPLEEPASVAPSEDFIQSNGQTFATEIAEEQLAAQKNEQNNLPNFNSWINQFQPPILSDNDPEQDNIQQAEGMNLLPDVEEDSNDPNVVNAKILAEKSVTESKSIASETLAKLYADQGFIDKAIEMYERLCLAFPDKSAYFAAAIEKIKK